MDNYTIIYMATRDGVFWGSFYGAVAFHIMFFGTIFIAYLYINRKYGSIAEIVGNFIKKFV